MNFNNIKYLQIAEGSVEQIADPSGNILWEKTRPTALISSGIQAIDTGVYCNETMSCEIKIAWTALPSNATYIGAIEYDGSNYLRCHYQCAKSNNSWVIGFWQDSPTMGNAVYINFDTNPHILTYSAPNLTVGIDGNTATHGNTPPPSNSTFYLFDRNVVGFTANAEPGKCKLYYAKFWYGNELVRHLVPNFDANNKMCLFDKVNGRFYYDINGNNFDFE